jgi:hypothetical protein
MRYSFSGKGEEIKVTINQRTVGLDYLPTYFTFPLTPPILRSSLTYPNS